MIVKVLSNSNNSMILNAFLTKFHVYLINVYIVNEQDPVGRTPGRQLHGKLLKLLSWEWGDSLEILNFPA